jgi:tetratricopeptide (TPR) repeat protein
LLELTLHNAVEQRLARASLQRQIDAHLAEGKKLLAENRYGEAEHELAEVVSLSPDDPQAHILLAQALEAEGKHPEAAGELQTSLKLDDSAAAHISLARVYLSMHQPELARSQGQAALHLDPGNPQAVQLMQQIQAGAPAARKTP